MRTQDNRFGQEVGFPVSGWTAPERPSRTPMQGRYGRLEPLSAERHGDDLWQAFGADDGRMWTYLAIDPPADRAALQALLEQLEVSEDPLFFAIVDGDGDRALGWASLMRIDPANGVIETGFIAYAPALQRTRLATEAMYLLMVRVFDALGYRRYEWKCDALNAPSRAAAKRLGFTFEGIFRQALVYKARNRDTAWFSILDSEWPAQKAAFEAWLDPANFDPSGRQRGSLSSLTAGGT
ncbi:MAG: GNAT family protein [Alphaproteobacteria bacterium]|jgi:RimJ/RimL family protein N-acetyltransferase|nr:GNAT family protein [Alphaproteobacteria bacterium]MDP6567669.1 GNAT family protein [Alphaproteobacteria bacterium]MDP6813195.1 GNAT family protein [Alphaproteobacteria bacterium]